MTILEMLTSKINELKKNSQEDLQEMYDVLGKFIEDHTSVHKILKASSYEEFMRIMKES